MTDESDLQSRNIKQLLEEIKSENPRVRSAAAERLGVLSTGIEALQIATTDRNSYVRAAAAEALGAFERDEAALYLGDLLFDTNPFVRSAAIRSLGRIGATEYAGTISEALEDSNPHIRAAAMRTLSELRAPATAELLVEGLEDPHRKIRLDAARGLRNLAEPSTFEPMHQALNKALENPRRDLPFINTLIQALAAAGTVEQVGPLLVTLIQEAVGCRTVAARSLRSFSYEPARRTLERSLTDRNPNLRLAALQALTQIGVGPSVESVRVLLEDEDSRVQRAACRVLVEAEDEEVIPVLRELALSPNPFLRPRALQGLIELDAEGNRDFLVALLTDNNIAVRETAIDALAAFVDQPEVRGALREAHAAELTDRLRAKLADLLNGHGH